MWPTPKPQHVDPLASGWSEYILPNSSYYYFNLRTYPVPVVTDVDLRNIHKLEAITTHLERGLQWNSGKGGECWIRDTAAMKDGFEPWMRWVNHDERNVRDWEDRFDLSSESKEGNDSERMSELPDRIHQIYMFY